MLSPYGYLSNTVSWINMKNIRSFIQKFMSDGLARNSAIVLTGTMVANVLSYLYHLIMGRILGPSGYGELSSLLSLIYIFTVPLAVAQNVLVKFISGFKAHGEVGQAKTLLVKSTKSFIFLVVIGIPFILIAGPYISSFLHLPSTMLMILLYILLAVSLLTVAPLSMLTGYQKFVWISAVPALGVLIKLIVSLPFVSWGVQGLLLAAVVAGVIVYGVYFIPLRFLRSVRTASTHLKYRDLFGFAVPTLLAQLGITSLYSMDIILVRHFFSSHEAGLYAALAILGKIIFYASSAIPVVLFPVASERSALGSNTRKLILSAVGTVAAISTGITLAYFLFPNFIVSLLFGDAYNGTGAMLGLFGIFLGLFSIGNIITMSCLAVGRTRIWTLAAVAAIIQIVGISISHGTIGGVIYINIGVCLIYDIASAAYYLLGSYEKV